LVSLVLDYSIKITYHSRFIPKGVAEVSQLFLQPMFYQNDLAMRYADVIDDKPIAISSQSIPGVSDVGPLVAIYDIHERNGKVLFHYSVPNTTRDYKRICL
jgi:hypothetical protein